MFILCRYLRDAGIDAQLVTLSDEPAHFSPGADSYDENYKAYYTVLPITKSTLYKPESIDLLKATLKDFDFFIGSDIAPALTTLIGRKLDVFIPHGSDIYALPFAPKRKKGTDKVWWLREKDTLSKLQKIGIESVTTILFPDEYDIHFPFKDKLTTKATYHNTSGPMVYIPQYKGLLNKVEVKQLDYYDQFYTLRQENDLLIFSHSRHNGFTLPEELAIHQKGNHHLIKGFAGFTRNNPTVKTRLIFFEYGMDVDASKKLIKTEGITNQVVWMPLMPRKEIMFGLNSSDISCGQYENSWLTCGVVNETLASEIPLLHYREDHLYQKDYADLYPLLNANAPEDITVAIQNYWNEPEVYKAKAKKGADWLHKYTVENPLKIVKEAMKNQRESHLENSALKEVFQVLKKYNLRDKIYRAQGKIKNKLKG